MSERLEVLQDQTYTVDENETIEYAGLDQYGETVVHGQLTLVDEPDIREPTLPNDVQLEWSLDLPTEPLNLRAMDLGISVFLVGTLGLLGGAAAYLKNYAAGIVWALAIVSLIFSGLFGIGLEFFWTTVVACLFLLGFGMVIRSMS